MGVEVNPEAVEAALSALTEFEAETAFARSLVERKRFCKEIVTEQKMQMIKEKRSHGILAAGSNRGGRGSGFF